MGHFVYKYVNNNEIIYIGKNDTNLYDRLKQHGKLGDNIPEEAWDEINSSEVFFCELPNSVMSDVVESELIRRYKPKWNKAKTSNWDGLNFAEPVWKPAYNKNENLIKEKNYQINLLKKKIDEQEKEITKLKKSCRYEEDYFSLASRYEQLLESKKRIVTFLGNNTLYSFESICNWYKDDNSDNGVFEATAYDSEKNIIAYKKIYVDFLGRLYFEFEQKNRTPVSGVIFWQRTDKQKKNYATLRNWMNAGANEYIKVV